eukprot:GFUD01072229.1.p1 GENE.GFUD01072229.1~~GFUD01072229.1.p1  ORF type:complete len:178 (-),score=33.05 GFUD01072229.1:212-745(-)
MNQVRSKVTAIFSKHPLVANCLTYGTLYTGSELLQQTILRATDDGDRTGYDWESLARFAVLGTAVFPPLMFHWYKFLDARYVGVGAGLVARKVMMDQLIFTPPMIATFFIGMSLLEGKPDITKEFREKALPTFVANLGFWIPAHVINFRLIPPAGRVVYIGICSLLWVNFLCAVKRS